MIGKLNPLIGYIYNARRWPPTQGRQFMLTFLQPTYHPFTVISVRNETEYSKPLALVDATWYVNLES